MHLATKRIKNILTFEMEIGEINFVVPDVVIKELENLTTDYKKTKNATITLEYIKNWKKVPITGEFADSAIIEYIKKNGGIIATLDKVLKTSVKKSGGSVISLSSDRIIMESS